VLSPLQERAARIISALPEAAGFALAGGAALVIRGLVDRTTRDLDFFSTDPAAVAGLLLAVEAALVDAGLGVERERVAEGFARLAVTDGNDSTIVDLGYDFRLHAPEDSPLGPVLAADDVAASKLLALFARAEPRDFVDVFALANRYGFEGLCSLALDRDRGFNLSALADALGSFEWLSRRDFEIDDAGFAQLTEAVMAWRTCAREGG
jgi:hypothetical protein